MQSTKQTPTREASSGCAGGRWQADGRLLWRSDRKFGLGEMCTRFRPADHAVAQLRTISSSLPRVMAARRFFSSQVVRWVVALAATCDRSCMGDASHRGSTTGLCCRATRPSAAPASCARQLAAGPAPLTATDRTDRLQPPPPQHGSPRHGAQHQTEVRAARGSAADSKQARPLLPAAVNRCRRSLQPAALLIGHAAGRSRRHSPTAPAAPSRACWRWQQLRQPASGGGAAGSRAAAAAARRAGAAPSSSRPAWRSRPAAAGGPSATRRTRLARRRRRRDARRSEKSEWQTARGSQAGRRGAGPARCGAGGACIKARAHVRMRAPLRHGRSWALRPPRALPPQGRRGAAAAGQGRRRRAAGGLHHSH